MEEWRILNDKVENWVIRGTQVLQVGEACRLNANVRQVTEKVDEASKALLLATGSPEGGQDTD